MNPVTIRAAGPDDASQMAALRWEFRAGRDAPSEDRDLFVARCAAWMHRELAAAAPWRAWIAGHGERIVGQVWLDVLQKVPNPIGERERHAYLSNLFVRPEVRGGAGTRLLDEALAWCRANGVDRVVLWPTPRSVSLYTRHGFTHAGDVMELKC